MTTDQPQPKVTTFRVDADVLARLDAYAARTRRSRNSAVNYLLQVGLDHEADRNLPEGPQQ
jgi:predicted transcriptional regulator